MAAAGEFRPVRDDATGDLFLPASRRPDGTWRKPRRVKEGYIPQDEVPAYESKGKQWVKSQPTYPIGMNPALVAASAAAANKKNKDDKPSIPGLPPTAASTKKKKKKPKVDASEATQVASKLACFTIEEPKFEVQTKTENAECPSLSDPAKRLKNVKKKLRDIEALEAKINSGELKKPEKDQLDKIKRKSEVLREIEELEMTVSKA
nr:EOG090X0KVN [Ilyocryptus agilis]